MNIKMKSIVTVLAMSALAFAAEPAAPTAVRAADAAAPVAAAPAAAPAPEAAPAAPAAQAAPAAAPEAQAPAAPAEEPVVEPVAPTAVRAADAAAPVATAPAPAEPAPVAAAPAPTQQRRVDVDTLQPAVVYRTTTVPVKTVYVAERSGEDSVTLDELRGLVPLRFAIGAQAFLGGYFLNDYAYYDNSFSDYTWRVGLSSVLPLNKFTVALKLGVLYEQSLASGTLHYDDRSARSVTVYTLDFKQRKIDVPVLFSFKAPYSGLMFDLGLQASFAVYDKFKLSTTQEGGKKHSERIDMLDEGYRKKMGWDLVFGIEYWANKHIALDVRFEGGFSDLYDSFEDDVIKLSDLSSSAFLIGFSYYL
jgi:hypothetical protein